MSNVTSDKLKEVIAKLKKQNKEEVKPKEEPELEEEEDMEEDEEETDKKPVIKEPVKPVEDEKLRALVERIRELQDNGVFRLNLLVELAELNSTLRVLTASIMKIGGIDNDESVKKE